MSELVLHGFWRSSSSHRVRIALALKGVPHRRNPVHLGKREQLQPGFLSRHPAGQVPVLEVGDLRLTQSVAILQYLELRWPAPPLFPREPVQAARVWEVVERVNSFLQPLQLPGTVRRHLLAHLPGEPKGLEAGVVAFVKAQLMDSLGRLEAHLGPVAGRYAVGDTVTAADVLLVPQLDGAERMGLDLSGLPTLCGLRARCQALDAFQVAACAAQSEAPR